MALKYNTLALDSGGEIARLLFSWELKKKSSEMEKIRQPNNYPGMTERLDIIVRALRNLRDLGMNVVITGHEDIQAIYAKGGMIAAKNEPAPEPIAVRGWLDIPGRTSPQELERVIDQLFHVRTVNGKVQWIARKESIGPGAGDWDVKDRFDACSHDTGILPPSYKEIKQIFSKHPNWQDSFIWAIYGPPGIGKTRQILTFPPPIKILDVDKGHASIRDYLKLNGGSVRACIPGSKDNYTMVEKESFPIPVQGKQVDIITFDSEDYSSYMPFLQEISECLK